MRINFQITEINTNASPKDVAEVASLIRGMINACHFKTVGEIVVAEGICEGLDNYSKEPEHG